MDGRRTADPGSLDRELSLSVLTLVLALALWLACGSLILGVADGGSHPARRALIGALLVALTAAALWRRPIVWGWLVARPWLVIVLALVQLGAAVIDGLLASTPYLIFSTTSVALAVLAARPRIVWLTVVVLELGYAAAVVAEQRPAQLIADGHASGVTGAMLSYPFVAILGFAIVRVFARFVAQAHDVLDEIRAGAPALTLALTLAVRDGPRSLLQLPAPPRAALTPAERRVVEGLADGSTPKQLAARWNVSITTVRTHIRHAKRKTGARTLAELAGMASRANWGDRAARDA